MGKILTVLLGVGALGFAAYWYISNKSPAEVGANVASAPKRRLDNVRGAAQRIEQDAERRAAETLQKTAGE